MITRGREREKEKERQTEKTEISGDTEKHRNKSTKRLKAKRYIFRSKDRKAKKYRDEEIEKQI